MIKQLIPERGTQSKSQPFIFIRHDGTLRFSAAFTNKLRFKAGDTVGLLYDFKKDRLILDRSLDTHEVSVLARGKKGHDRLGIYCSNVISKIPAFIQDVRLSSIKAEYKDSHLGIGQISCGLPKKEKLRSLSA